MRARDPPVPSCRVRALPRCSLGSVLLGVVAGLGGHRRQPAEPGVYVVTLAAAARGVYAGGRPGLRATSPAPGRAVRPQPARRRGVRRVAARPPGPAAARGRRPGRALPLHHRPGRLRRQPDSDQVRGSGRADDVVRGRAQHQAARRPGQPPGRALGLARPARPPAPGRGTAARPAPAGASWSASSTPASGRQPELQRPRRRHPRHGAAACPASTAPATPAEEWTADDCSDKVVSARWFVKGFGEENTAGAEYLSPRDGTGHGSHVASTAAGDHGVRVEVDGQRFGTTSGMAPAARLAVYKACWSAPDPSDDGCSTADTVAAVDQAVADGVDVLNYSVSGSAVRDDSVERAFLGAASAGVFVAASAGNAGPRPGSVRHVAPVGDDGRPPAPTTCSRVPSGWATAARTSARWSPTPPSAATAPGARRRRRRPRRDPGRRPSLRRRVARRVRGAGRDRGVRARRGRPGRQVRVGGRLRRRRHGAGEPPAGEHRRRRARRTHRPPGRP